MNFIANAFLWLLPLAAIPIIIHFLNRRNFVVLPFSSIRFLKKLEHESIKKLRILQLLLLIIRVLIVLTIVLMVARPIIGIQTTNSESKFSAILLDNSFSILDHQRDSKRWETFRRLIEITEEYEEFSDQLFTFSERIDEFEDPSILQGHRSEKFVDGVDAVLKGKNRDYVQNDLIVVSDFQTSNYGEWPQKLKMNDWNIHCLKLPQHDDNLGIVDVKVLNELLIANTPLSLEVSVVNNGLLPIENRLLQLFIDNINVGQQLINLNAGQSAEFRFESSYYDTGDVPAQLQLEDDDFEKDNQFFFKIHFPRRLQMAVVESQENDALFLRNALQVLNRDSLLFDLSWFNPTSVQSMNFNILQTIILLGDPGFSAVQTEELYRFVQRGGHLLLFPESESGHIFKFNDWELGSLEMQSLGGDDFQNIANIGDELLQNTLAPEGNLDDLRFYRFLQIDYQKSVFSTEAQNPLFLQRNIGQGYADIFLFAPSLDWTNFPIRAQFIPFLHFALYMNEKQMPIYYSPSDNITIDSGRPFWEDGLQIYCPDGKFRHIEYKESEVKIENLKMPGFYSLKSGDYPIEYFSVNPVKSEIKGEYYDENAIQQYFDGHAEIHNSTESLLKSLNEESKGMEIWHCLAIALAVLVILEMILSHEFDRSTTRNK